MVSEAHLDIPQHSNAIPVSMSGNGDAVIALSVEQITDISLDRSGALLIEYEGGDGAPSKLLIENFKELAGNEGCLKLNDGAEIDSHVLYDDLCNKSGICTISKPQAGGILDVPLQADKQYDLRFDVEKDTQTISQDSEGQDKLVLTFADGAKIIFQTAQEMIREALDGDAAQPHELKQAGSSEFLSALEVIEELIARMKALEIEQAQNQEPSPQGEAELAALEGQLADELANLEPADGAESQQDATAEELAVAEQLAQVEPAAGGNAPAAGGLSSAGGYGFQSVFNAVAVKPLDDVGPINPTALQYGIDQIREDLMFDERDDEVETPPNYLPSIADDVQTVDETDGFSLSQSGTVIFSFGGDGAGAVAPAGWSVSHGSLAGGVLQSGGVPVNIVPTALGYEGVAGGQTVFTLTIDPQTGNYTYNQVLPFDHADGANPDDVISLDFGIAVMDGNGDSAQSVLTIHVLDDAPSAISHEISRVDETNMSPDAHVTGQITADFGNDGAGAISGNGAVPSVSLTSGGEPVTITYDAVSGVYTGATATQTVFTLAIASNGTYDFTLVGTLDHPDAHNPNDYIVLDFGVRATDFDGDSIDGSLTIKVLDDAPSCISSELSRVDETNMSPDAHVTGQITADFGNDGAGAISGNGAVPSVSLTSGGEPVTITYDAVSGVYTGATATQTVFTLAIASNGTYDFTLVGTLDHPNMSDSNDYIRLDFGVRATDFDGDSIDGTLTIKVLDDGPMANDDCFAVENSVTGNVMDNDALSMDAQNTVTHVSFKGVDYGVPTAGQATVQGDFGTLKISADGTFLYTLTGGGAHSSSSTLNPVAADVAGVQNSISKDGITVSVANVGRYDLSWVNTADGSGLGIDNLDTSDSTKAWPQGEAFNIGLDENAKSVTITIAELGSNNNSGRHGLDMVITLENGAQVAAEQQFVPGQIIDGEFTFTLNASDFGGLEIASVRITSVDSGVYMGGSFLLNNVSATYGDMGQPHDEFVYTLQDGDGDTSQAKLCLDGITPVIVVGENVSDTEKSSTPHHIGGDDGVIAGAAGSDILVGDVGGTTTEQPTQDYNFVFIVDVSGSMATKAGATARIELLKAAVEQTLNDLGNYKSGEIMVHITPFSTTAGNAGTFNVTDPVGLTAALNYIDGLSANGYTNYEAPMQEAIGWLQSGAPIGGNAITTTYFISDGEPNRYMNNSGNVATGNVSTIINEITGSDGTNEVALLQSLSDEVVGVGINISGEISRLNVIDSDGHSINVKDPHDLQAVLQNINPIYKLVSVGGDVIEGSGGDDIIFGDSVNTDHVADAHGLTTPNGEGWKVFDTLEADDPSWDRADTVEYVRTHADELAVESHDASGAGRVGGDDNISGGDGNDMIFGQEGNDIIYGGAGNDILSGGSGADQFLFKAISEGIDVIRDFSVGEGDVLDFSSMIHGFDPTQQAINDFVFAREEGGGTILSVDVTGSGNASAAVDIVALEGVNHIDLQALFESGNINVF